MVKEALKDFGLDPNQYYGLKTCSPLEWLLAFDRNLKYTEHYIENKFPKKPGVVEANKVASKSRLLLCRNH